MSLGKEIKQKIDSVRHEALLNIVYTANQLDKASRAFFEGFGITEAQYNVMVVIKLANQKLTQVEISERMVSSRANITSLIDKLQKKGYVCRCQVPGDRRVHQVELTAKGLKKVDEVEPNYLKIIEKIMKCLSAAESRELSGLLDKTRGSFNNAKGAEDGK